MSKTHDMADREIERLLSGWRPAEDDSQGLARFFKDLDEASPLPSTDHCEAAHVSAMVEASRLPNSADSLTPRPVGNTTRPKPRKQGSPKTGRMIVRLPLLHKVVSMPIRIVAMIAAFMVVGGGVALAAGITGGFAQAPGTDVTTTVTLPGAGAGQPGTTDVTADQATGSDETDCTDVDCTDVNCKDDDCTGTDCPCVECPDDDASDDSAIDDDTDANDTQDTEVDEAEDGDDKSDAHNTEKHDLLTTSGTDSQEQED
jgi:hypothetical protein